MKNPLSLESLRDWLRTKPVDEVYCWADAQTCLLGQYLKHIGAIEIGSSYWLDANSNLHEISEQFFHVALHGHNLPHTFGAALERAEKIIASQ